MEFSMGLLLFAVLGCGAAINNGFTFCANGSIGFFKSAGIQHTVTAAVFAGTIASCTFLY